MVFGNDHTGPQYRDDIAAAINDSNASCFQVCGGGPVEASSIMNNNGDVRVCVMNSANAALC